MDSATSHFPAKPNSANDSPQSGIVHRIGEREGKGREKEEKDPEGSQPISGLVVASR